MKTTKIFLFTLLAIFSLSFITNVAQANSSASASVTVTVTPAPIVNPPTVSLTADSYSLAYNGSTILHILGTNASYCILSWPGGSNTQGLKWDYTTPALTATTAYTLTCGNKKADEVSDSKTITVAPKPITYTVSTLASPTLGGSISPTSAIIDEGKTTSFVITPNTGYSISGVTGCNGTGTSSYTTGAINADCKVTASFSLNSCPAPTTKIITGITCDVNANGDAAISGSVTRQQTKTAPSCTFGTPVNNTNSTYVSDTCKYPTKVCANGAVNYSLCTVDKNNKCLNGNTNPPACTTPPPAGMSGILNASDCTIPIGQSSCNANFSWKVTNPINPGKSVVTTPVNKTLGRGDLGSNTINLPYNSTANLFLYNNGDPFLDKKTVKSIIDTTISQWNPNGGSNGTGIVETLPQQGNQNNNGNGPVPPLPLPSITSFTIKDSKGADIIKSIKYNTFVNIAWTSVDAVSCDCTSADKKNAPGPVCGSGNGTSSPSTPTLPLKKSMTFTLSCTNANGVSTSPTSPQSKTVTVDDINTIYKEN